MAFNEAITGTTPSSTCSVCVCVMSAYSHTRVYRKSLFGFWFLEAGSQVAQVVLELKV